MYIVHLPDCVNTCQGSFGKQEWSDLPAIQKWLFNSLGGVLFAGVLKIRELLLFRVRTRAPDFWKLASTFMVVGSKMDPNIP